MRPWPWRRYLELFKWGTPQLLLLELLLGPDDIGLQIGVLEPREQHQGADKEQPVAAPSDQLAAGEPEVKVLPAHDVLDSEHAEVVLVELEVGLPELGQWVTSRPAPPTTSC